MPERITILIGTAKDAFLLASDERRLEWSLTGPYCDGWPVNHVVGDSDTGTIWAAGGGEWDGAGVWRSENGGKTWTLAKLSAGQRDEWAKKDPEAAEFFGWDSAEAPFTGEIDAIWSLRKAHGAVVEAMIGKRITSVSWMESVSTHFAAQNEKSASTHFTQPNGKCVNTPWQAG